VPGEEGHQNCVLTHHTASDCLFVVQGLRSSQVSPEHLTRPNAPSEYDADALPGAREPTKTVNTHSPDSRHINHLQSPVLGIILLHTLRGLTQDEQLMSQHDEMQSVGLVAPEDTTRMENRDTEPAESARYRRPMPPHHPRTNPSCGHLLRLQIQLLAILPFAQAPPRHYSFHGRTIRTALRVPFIHPWCLGTAGLDCASLEATHPPGYLGWRYSVEPRVRTSE
jgi:hypothetical protein